MKNAPIIVWIRRDLRLADHAALTAAAQTGAPVIPLFIADDEVSTLGAAPKWRFGLGVAEFGKELAKIGSRLILRSGNPLDVLSDVISETGAKSVYWQRAYIASQVARDTLVKTQLSQSGVDARSFTGHLLFEPWSVATKTGGFYKVFTPMWKNVRGRDVGPALPKVTALRPPELWPASEALHDWDMGRGMNRGAEIVADYVGVGHDVASDRLALFLADRVDTYARDRDFPAIAATSRLSENLAYGEISPREAWNAAQIALHQGRNGAETFLRELVWREFSYHLAWHTPHMLTENWKPDWDSFRWANEGPQIARWQQGRTGEPFVDAAMREMYVTGTMHNRGRMIVASYLTKHLLTHWQVGQKWFEQCLIDWDPAANAMGWQWAAGCGPDAAPYFRVFNPSGQLDKFDKSRAYTAKFIAELSDKPSQSAQSYFAAVPRSWALSASDPYPTPLISLDGGRKRALTAYAERKSGPAEVHS